MIKPIQPASGATSRDLYLPRRAAINHSSMLAQRSTLPSLWKVAWRGYYSRQHLCNLFSSRLPQTRLLHSGAAAAELPLHEDVEQPEFNLQQLRSGLAYEASKGFCNTEGRQLFSQFATMQLDLLKQAAKEPEQRIQIHRLLSGFQRYDRLSIADRQSLVLRANSAIGGELLRFHPPLRSAVGAGDTQRLQSERRASHSQASTSGGSSSKAAADPPQNGMYGAPQAAGPDLAHVQHPGRAADSVGQDSRRTVDPNNSDSSSGFEALGLPAELGTSEADVAEPVSPSEDELAATEEDATSSSSGQAAAEGGALHWSFAAAAHQFSQSGTELELLQQEMLHGEQRSDAWHALRDNRLTASAFSNALGFWTDGRPALWEEKLGLREKFAGNEATDWGTVSEEQALARYVEITGHTVRSRSFQTLGDDLVTGWLGASPDGLIEVTEAAPGLRAAGFSRPPQGQGAGVLEIKCPFNKGEPTKAKPYKQAPWYYMPQVQGLMEVFNRDWCNVFSYTVNGSAMYHIKRDRRYWRDVYLVLADFWWGSVVPAKHALSSGDKEQALLYRPSEEHPLTEQLKERSKEMAQESKSFMYPPKLLAQPRASARTGR